MNPDARSRTLAAHDKLLLRLDRERQQLRKAWHQAPVIPLEVPYQQGWVRFFKLREDAQRREDVEYLREILTHVNTYQYSRDGNFVERVHVKGRQNPWRHEPQPFLLDDPMLATWPSWFRRYFEIRMLQTTNWRGKHTHVPHYVFKYPYYLKTVVQKHFVTHTRVRMGDIEARLAEIEAYLRHHHASPRLRWLKDCTYWYSLDTKPDTGARSNARRSAIEEQELSYAYAE